MFAPVDHGDDAGAWEPVGCRGGMAEMGKSEDRSREMWTAPRIRGGGILSPTDC